ncbi:MAG: hypothetical protein H6741_13215 [Alphaproteobacteria bacterium]|nr:hypothetical protein [Alphaproteobacteria bacterium]MCB9793676.1 hypothetical protein [Alphaproteobacteria bacterium]
MSHYFIMMAEPGPGGPVARRTSAWAHMLTRGEPLEIDPGLFEFVIEEEPRSPPTAPGPLLDWYEPDKGHSLFSGRMREVLAGAGVDNVQYFPARVSSAVSGLSLDHQVANIIGCVDLLDLERSDLVVDEDDFVEEIFGMVFDEARAEGRRLFRLGEFESLVIVRSDVRDAIERAGLTGMCFLRDVDYEPGMI